VLTLSRQCIFEGNLPDYIYQISFIYFNVIKNTVHIYQNCFSQAMMSACVKWAKEHVDNFNVILARQLSSEDRESGLWEKCMEQAHAHASMLSEVGIDFRDLIGKGADGNGGNGTEGVGPVGLGVSS
jgi:hypothetical protein